MDNSETDRQTVLTLYSTPLRGWSNIHQDDDDDDDDDGGGGDDDVYFWHNVYSWSHNRSA